jgi:hypothetical protein
MKVIVSGSRDTKDADALLERVMTIAASTYHIVPTMILHGASGNVDWAADAWAKRHGVPCQRYWPDWSLGKRGGPARNETMARYGEALVALWDGQSCGGG